MSEQGAEPRQRRPWGPAISAVFGTWSALYLVAAGISGILYVMLGRPSWYGWLNLIAVPLMLFASWSAGRRAYEDTPVVSTTAEPQARRKWSRSDTLGLIVRAARRTR